MIKHNDECDGDFSGPVMIRENIFSANKTYVVGYHGMGVTVTHRVFISVLTFHPA